MNFLNKIIGVFVICAFSIVTIQAQDKEKKEPKVTIKTDKGELTPEEWGDELGNKISDFIEGTIKIDEDMIENALQNAFSNMEINVRDIDPEKWDENENNFNINGTNLRDIIKDIEKSEGSKIKNIKELNLKFLGEGKTRMRLKTELENGKTVNRTEVIKD